MNIVVRMYEQLKMTHIVTTEIKSTFFKIAMYKASYMCVVAMHNVSPNVINGNTFGSICCYLYPAQEPRKKLPRTQYLQDLILLYYYL